MKITCVESTNVILYAPESPLVADRHLHYLLLVQTGSWLVALPVAPAPIVPPPSDVSSVTLQLYDELSCRTHTYVLTNTHTYTYIHTNIMYVIHKRNTHTHAHTHAHTCARTHTHAHTHTHTHKQNFTDKFTCKTLSSLGGF